MQGSRLESFISDFEELKLLNLTISQNFRGAINVECKALAKNS